MDHNTKARLAELESHMADLRDEVATLTKKLAELEQFGKRTLRVAEAAAHDAKRAKRHCGT